MKLIKQIIPIAIIITLMTSCASSRIVLSSNADVSKYKYVIFGSESSGDRELDDIIMAVQNQIAETNLKVLSTSNISKVLECSDSILTPNIHVTSEKWDGGHTYITVTKSLFIYNVLLHLRPTPKKNRQTCYRREREKRQKREGTT